MQVVRALPFVPLKIYFALMVDVLFAFSHDFISDMPAKC